jgi:chorismate mutase
LNLDQICNGQQTAPSSCVRHRCPPQALTDVQRRGYVVEVCGVGHDVRVDTPPQLRDLRDRIDRLDEDLVATLAARARAVEEVVLFKQVHDLRVVDRGREDAMIERIGDVATQAGLDARVARQVLRAIIDAFTLLEVEQLGRD